VVSGLNSENISISLNIVLTEFLTEMARRRRRVSTNKRKNSKQGQFAPTGNRKLPINDVAHVRNATAHSNHVESKSCHPAVARRLVLAGAKKFGVDVGEFKHAKSLKNSTKEG
jgi:hypothetical protein